MARTALTLALFAALAAWASAQGPVTMSDELRMLRTNRGLLTDLLDHGVKLSDNGGTPLARAGECRRAAETLGAALRGETDEERIAELSDRLAAVVREGLAPNVRKARDEIPRGSPDYDRLRAEAERARKYLDDLGAALPQEGKLGRSPQVEAARRKLAEAAGRVSVPAE